MAEVPTPAAATPREKSDDTNEVRIKKVDNGWLVKTRRGKWTVFKAHEWLQLTAFVYNFFVELAREDARREAGR